MAKLLNYAIKRNGLYLHGIEINEHYSNGAKAPTMGNLHTPCEYKTNWGKEKRFFEPLTASSYIKIIFEEYRWETKKAEDLKIEVEE